MYQVLELTILALCFALGSAVTGVDVSQSVSVSTWQCLEQPGGQGPVNFGIARVYKSTGAVDSTGVQNIKNAKSAGVRYVDGYIFPCYSCGDAGGQVEAAYNAVKYTGYGMLWYDVENYKWSTSQSKNQAFIEEMVNTGLSLGVTAGIYSSYYNWQSIVGLNWNYPASKGLPIWYAHYDNKPSFSDYKAFGGWSRPAIKQYIGDASSCGVGVDYDYYPSAAHMEEVRQNATLLQSAFM